LQPLGGTDLEEEEEEEEEEGGDLFVFNDTIEGPRAPAVMMMSFICFCRNKKAKNRSQAPYTLRKVRTIRGCLEGLALMI
jgi:hypothetical protein